MLSLAQRTEIDDLKARVDLADLVRRSGVELKQVGKNLMGCCPFHDGDRTPSLSVNEAEHLWNCLGCEAGGDAVSFIQLREKVDFPKAVERLKELALQAPAPAKPNGKKTPGPLDPLPGNLLRKDLLGRVAELYFKRFRECDEPQKYLIGRGLGSRELWDNFRVGYSDGSMLDILPKNGPTRDALAQLGVLNGKGREHFKGCVVVPLEHPDEGIVGFYGRKIEPDAQFPHLYLPGPKRGVLHWQAIKQARRVWLTESVLDAFSLWTAGIRDVTCLFGAGSLPADLEATLGRFSTQEVVFCLDGDRAGQDATMRHAERLAARGPRCLNVILPAGKDPNQLLLQEGADSLKERALQGRPITAPQPEPRSSDDPEMEPTTNGFTMRIDEVRYRAIMIGPFVGRLRCALTAARGQRFYSEKLDLHSHRARSLNASQLVRVLEISRADADRHLNLLLRAALEWSDAQKAVDGKPTRKQAPELSEVEQADAIAFLRQPNLVEAILQDCEALGFVGEEKGKLLAYLIGLSRKLPKPLSGIVVSSSGAGKSTLTEMVEQLVPPEDVMFYSRLTPQALYYMCHNLTGMLLMLEERAGGEGADYSIRTLQSRKKLKLATPVKDPVTGKQVTQDIEVEGPVAYLETTTNPYLNPENSSRCFELFMDESEEQTRRIHAQQRRNRLLMEYDDETVAEAIRKKHQNAQRMLKTMRVYIPYVEKLSFPSLWLRTRRDNERFLCLIEVITFLHQHQREQGQTLEGKPYVLANLADYRLAYELAKDVLSCTLHELTKGTQDLWAVLVPYVLARAPKAPKEFPFTFKDLRAATNLTNHRLRSSMTELVEMEYVSQVSGQNGSSFHFKLLTTDVKSLPSLAGLTSPDELEELLRES
jgi:DNA primase catalytic core